MTPELVSLADLDSEPHATLFEGEPKTIRLSLSAGEAIAPHQHPDRRIVFHVLDGELEVTIGEESYRLCTGDVARFDGDQDISPEAIENSEALLVMVERPD